MPTKADVWKGFHTLAPTQRTCFLLERVEHFDPWEFEALLIDTGRELYEIEVMTRPFSLGGVWFGASWETTCALATKLGLAPLTRKVADVAFCQAVEQIPPQPQARPPSYTLEAYRRHTAAVRRAITLPPSSRSLVADIGKDWVAHPLHEFGTYGWRVPSAPQVWQGVPTHPSPGAGAVRMLQAFDARLHSRWYESEYQTVRLMRRECSHWETGGEFLRPSERAQSRTRTAVGTILEHRPGALDYGPHPHERWRWR